MTVSLVSLLNIKKSFTIREGLNRVVLDGISLTINLGDWISIGGSSGSGKTTILQVINGEIQVDEGEVQIINDHTSIAKKIVYVDQQDIIRPYLTVLENLLEENNDYEKAIELLKATEIEDVKDSYYDELSGGEYKRAALCRSIMSSPSLLLIDEPTSNLDLTNSKLILSFLDSLWHKGVTLVIVSHSSEVLNMGRRKFILKSGQLVKID
ncbi:MAG: ATP-binding cassette domain-containing protein [Candidatus Kariarchaeaceae archaeon]